MTKTKLSDIIDCILITLFVFILLFSWIKFYTKNIILSILIGIFATFLLIFIYFFVKSKKIKKTELSKKQKQLAQNCALQLSFSTQKSTINYFEKLLNNNYNITKHTNFLILKNNNQKILFAPLFNTEKIKNTNLAQLYAIAKEKNCSILIISGIQADEEVKNLSLKIKNIKIEIWDCFTTYNKLIKDKNLLPDETVDTSISKLNIKQILKYAFDRKRMKNYLLFGLILIISSFFVYYKIYYLIFGTIMIIIALLTIILPHKQKITS